MRRHRTKAAVIGSVVVVLAILGAVVAEAFIVGRSAPLGQPPAESSASEPAPSQAVIVLREQQPTPEPTPVPTVTPKPTPAPTEKPAATPAPSTKPPAAAGGHSSKPAGDNGSSPTGGTDNSPEVTFTPPEEPTPAPHRPEVIETTPEPTPRPSITSISLDTGSLNILVGDSWRITILSAPESVYSSGATWNTSNSAVVGLSGADLSGVTVSATAPGTATVTIYSRDGQYSASCSVTVSQ